jgi:hypothetical protein
VYVTGLLQISQPRPLCVERCCESRGPGAGAPPSQQPPPPWATEGAWLLLSAHGGRPSTDWLKVDSCKLVAALVPMNPQVGHCRLSSACQVVLQARLLDSVVLMELPRLSGVLLKGVLCTSAHLPRRGAFEAGYWEVTSD